MKRIAKTLFIGLFIAAASFSCGSDDSTSNKPEVVDPTPGPGPEPEPGVKTDHSQKLCVN